MLHRVAIHTRIVTTRKSRARGTQKCGSFFASDSRATRSRVSASDFETSRQRSSLYVRILRRSEDSSLAMNGELIILYGGTLTRRILITWRELRGEWVSSLLNSVNLTFEKMVRSSLGIIFKVLRLSDAVIMYNFTVYMSIFLCLRNRCKVKSN